jgi:hypothetical protein
MRLRDLNDIKQHHPWFTVVLEMDRECDESLMIWRRPSVGGKVQLAIELLLYQVSKSMSFCERHELISPSTSWKCVREPVQIYF